MAVEWRNRREQQDMVMGREYLFWFPDSEPPEIGPDSGYAHVQTWTGRWPNGEGEFWADLNAPEGWVYTSEESL